MQIARRYSLFLLGALLMFAELVSADLPGISREKGFFLAGIVLFFLSAFLIGLVLLVIFLIRKIKKKAKRKK